jgi:phosphoketolase
VVGHWEPLPVKFIYGLHLNRAIKKYDLIMTFTSGPRHSCPALVGNVYLEGNLGEVYQMLQDEEGLKII